MPIPRIEPTSFFIGFFVGIIFWLLLARARPLWDQIRENAKERRETAKVKRTTGLEDNHRRITLRRAQGMHLAASLFALDDILQEPRLIAPPARVEPGVIGLQEDIISQTLPYMSDWPELAAVYGAPTLTLTDAISGGANIVITGAAGAGKTVALAHLASLAANLKIRLDSDSEVAALPYLYHVADLALPHETSKDPLNVLTTAVTEFAPFFDLGRLPGFVQRTFQTGQALLLVDGFDELDTTSQQAVTVWFKALMQAYPKSHIVTTGCPTQLNGLISLGFSPLALMSWNQRTVANFVRQWGEQWSQTVAAESWEKSDPAQVDPLLVNSWVMTDNHGLTPFELTLKVWGAHAGDSLGPRVLDAIATHLRRVAPSGTPVAALELLAMQVVLTAQPVFEPRTARAWVKQYDIVDDKPTQNTEPVSEPVDGEKRSVTESQKIRIKKSKASEGMPSYGLLGKMVDSGLLISHSNNKLRFLHSVLKGYLAGPAIGDNDADRKLLTQPNWNGKTLSMHYLAARRDASAAVEVLVKESELPLHSTLFAAAHWLRDAPKDAAWRGKVFANLLTVLQAEGQPLGLRGQAMSAFVTSNDPGTAALFRQLLGAKSFELIPLAALGSGAIRDSKAVEALEAAMQAPIGSVRRASCLALITIGTEKAFEAVGRALLQGDDDMRKAAAEALANDPVEGYAMLREGAELKDIMVRRAVVHGLSRIEQTWAIELMQKMQVEDEQWVVRNLATQYLEQKNRSDPRIPQKLPTPSETPWLIEFAGKQGMGIPRGGPATEVFITAFKFGTTEERLAALPYLKPLANEGILGALYSGVYGEDPEVREAAFHAVQEIGANGTHLPHPNQFGLG